MERPLEKIDAKKSLGQHFLNNARVPKLMADAGDVVRGDIVLEVGPGTGILTRELLSRGATVVAIEADARAIASLQEPFETELSSGQLTLVHGDIRSFPNFNLPSPSSGGTLGLDRFNGLKPHQYKVVANIPYYLSGMLFRLFLESTLQPSTLVFLVQKEVALRIARDTKESILSLSIQVFGTPRYVKTIPRGNFTPAPKIDSAIIAVTDISRTHFTTLDTAFFFELLHIGFGSKRKQLLGNLTKIVDRETLTTIFSTLNLPLTIRGEDLPLTSWLALTEHIHRAIK